MSEQTTYCLECTRTDMRVLTAHFTGNATGNLVLTAPDDSAGDIVSATHSATGTYTVIFRRFFPRLKVAPIFSFTGVTAGLTGRCSAIDYTVNPPTATFVFSVGAVATDLPTTDTVDVTWIVRNSSKND